MVPILTCFGTTGLVRTGPSETLILATEGDLKEKVEAGDRSLHAALQIYPGSVFYRQQGWSLERAHLDIRHECIFLALLPRDE